MISEAEALKRILESIPASAVEDLFLLAARGRYAGADIFATVPLPGFDNSMMDGYAILAADSSPGNVLKVTGEQPAGMDLCLTVGPGEALRIFTGAPMPGGADAVIMQEDVDREGDSIRSREAVTQGENIRRRGADLCEGQLVLRRGQKLTPGRLGVLASQGLAKLTCHRTPKVAILSTGDELQPIGAEALKPGQIYNSNGIMLQALVNEVGIPECTAHHCQDDLKATTEMLERLLVDQDIIILSGGVSVGDHDHVKPALLRLGIPPELWRVKVKPGKPFLFARTPEEFPKFIFGLPGNPVSSFVTYQLFVRPALLRWMGAKDVERPSVPVQVTQRLVNDGDRPHYLRGCVEDGRFSVNGLQQSHALFALSQANALLRLEAHTTLESGASAQALFLD